MVKAFGNPFRPPGPKKNKDDDGDKKPPTPVAVASDPLTTVAAVAIPQLTLMALKSFLGFTVALYILNQKHMLPRPVAAVVSKALFWPTLPITLSRRIGKWVTPVDDTGTMV
jgi:hypothetical protein